MKPHLTVIFLIMPVLMAISVFRILSALQLVNAPADKVALAKNAVDTAFCRNFKPNFGAAKAFGSEDIAHFTDSKIFVGSSVFLQIGKHGAAGLQNGFIYVIDTLTEEAVQMTLVGFPKERHFFPHGISYSTTTNRLHVVSHTGQQEHLSVVEVFEVDYPRLKYLGSIEGGLLKKFNFGLNDVVEIGENRILVTNWHAFGVALEGTESPSNSFIQKAKHKLNGLLPIVTPRWMLQLIPQLSTKVIECKYSKSKTGFGLTSECNVLIDGLALANGVTADVKRKFFYVVDVAIRGVLKYSYEITSNGQLKAHLVETINLPDMVDNIEYDSKRDILTGGGIFAPLETMQALEHLDEPFPIPGSMIEISSKGEAKRTLYSSGKTYAGISSCVYTSDSTKAVCGSPLPTTEGVLICDLN